jgi:Ni,Fe-hydrogenase I large subunit
VRGAHHLERPPRDNQGQIGAFEASLMNTEVERAEEPVEILRTLHSFDPCLACSTHVMGRTAGNGRSQGALNKGSNDA